MTGACGSAAMLADPDNLPTLRASAAQPYYVATITTARAAWELKRTGLCWARIALHEVHSPVMWRATSWQVDLAKTP